MPSWPTEDGKFTRQIIAIANLRRFNLGLETLTLGAVQRQRANITNSRKLKVRRVHHPLENTAQDGWLPQAVGFLGEDTHD